MCPQNEKDQMRKRHVINNLVLVHKNLQKPGDHDLKNDKSELEVLQDLSWIILTRISKLLFAVDFAN